jgi:glycolate oxidase FAD binding subunit
VSAAGMTTGVADELRAICGASHIIEEPNELHHQHILGVTPSVAVAPGSADEVSAVLQVANEHGLSVIPSGRFTQQQSGNRPARVDVLLSTSRLTAVEHYDAGDLTVGVGAGCTSAQLSSMVAADGLFFALDPPSPEKCTIGGALATAVHGPLRHGYGSLRDFCIGIRFVTGDGRKAKGGGRVVKNVAGYDLMKLLIGSHGTLAVITSASFKLFPAPRQTRTFVAEFASAGDALQFRDRILGSPLSPMCLELVSPGARDVLRPDVSHSDVWIICVRATGSDAVLARYRAELGSDVTRQVEGENEAELWRALANFSEAVDAAHPRSLLISLSMPLRDVGQVLECATLAGESNGFVVGAIGRAGVGHLQVGFWPNSAHDVTLVNFVNAVSALRTGLPGDASMVVQRCPPEARHHVTAWGPTPTNVDSMRAVKNALDPRDILNRGRFYF